jgi:hypothetical protein
MTRGWRSPSANSKIQRCAAARDAIAGLRRYSLVTPAGNDLILVHPLVKGITRAQQSAEMTDQWEPAAAALVDAAVPAEPELPSAWPVFAVLLSHARAVLGVTSLGMRSLAQYLGNSGSCPAARDLFQLSPTRMRKMMPTGPSARTA